MTAASVKSNGLGEHDIPILVREGLLQPLGNPPQNAVKSFSTAQILELAGETDALNKIRRTVYEYWRGKNAEEARLCRRRDGHARLGN